MGSLLRSLNEAWEVPRDLLLGRYPPFVVGGTLPRGHVPVFVLHSAEPNRLERQLVHLAENGYATLDSEEYLGILQGTRAAPDRAVVLTFDDGRGSLWSVAAPLLERYGMKAVVFLVPGRMVSRAGPPAPTLADLEQGRVGPDAMARREIGPDALLSWEEVSQLGRSGRFDFQSHTFTHGRVHVAPELAGFVTPWSRQGYDAFDQPLVRQGDGDLMGEDVPLGTPLFRSEPRMSEATRFFEDESSRTACVEEVAPHGEAFFRQPDWESKLRSRLSGRPVTGRTETAEERIHALEIELVESKRLIEEASGRPVTSVCYPWHAFGPTAEGLARQAGYRAAFCGKVPGVPLTQTGGNLQRIARLGEDYIELLPGKGRTTLISVLRRKWTRRFGGA